MIAALNYVEVTRLKQKLSQTKVEQAVSLFPRRFEGRLARQFEQANSLFYLSTA